MEAHNQWAHDNTHDEGWDACLRLLEPHEKKMLQKASDEFNLGAMLSSLQDCVQPHLVWEICCRQDSTLTQACQKVGIQAERKTLENGYDILSPSTANKLKHEFWSQPTPSTLVEFEMWRMVLHTKGQPEKRNSKTELQKAPNESTQRCATCAWRHRVCLGQRPQHEVLLGTAQVSLCRLASLWNQGIPGKVENKRNQDPLDRDRWLSLWLQAHHTGGQTTTPGGWWAMMLTLMPNVLFSATEPMNIALEKQLAWKHALSER